MQLILGLGPGNAWIVFINVQNILENLQTTSNMVRSCLKTLITMSHAFDSEKVGRCSIYTCNMILSYFTTARSIILDPN